MITHIRRAGVGCGRSGCGGCHEWSGWSHRVAINLCRRAEQHIKEGKHAFRWTRLSCKRFRDNEVRLQLHALAYNLANFLRCIELPEAMADWSLTSCSSS